MFKFLIEKDLIYPATNNGNTVYLMNEVKETEWEDAISELRKPKWKRSKTFKGVGKIMVWIASWISAVIVAILGAYFTRWINSDANEVK